MRDARELFSSVSFFQSPGEDRPLCFPWVHAHPFHRLAPKSRNVDRARHYASRLSRRRAVHIARVIGIARENGSITSGSWVWKNIYLDPY